MMKTLTLNKLVLATGLLFASSTLFSQEYLGISRRLTNGDFRELGPVSTTYEMDGNSTLWFAPNTDLTSHAPTGQIGIKSSYTNEQYTNTTDTENPSSIMLYGATRSTTSKKINADDLLVRMSAIQTDNNYYSPTEDITGLDKDTYYGFEQYISVEEFENQGLLTSGRYYVGDIKYTFTKAVDNPIIHINGLGGAFADGITQQTQLFSADYELVIPQTSTGMATGVTGIKKLSSTSKTVLDGNTIKSNYSLADFAQVGNTNVGTYGDQTGAGSFVIEGTGITEVKFKLYIQGKATPGNEVIWSTLDTPAYNGLEQAVGERHIVSWTLPLYEFGGSVVVDNQANGTVGPDNGGEAYTSSSDDYQPLTAVLIDEEGNVAQTSPVSATDGTFDFQGVLGDAYKVTIVKTDVAPSVGDAAPAAVLPDAYKTTEEQFDITVGRADLTPDSVTDAFRVTADNVNDVKDNTLIIGIQKSDTILPVELISFEGVASGDNADLTWATATERNSSHFDVERSLDGVTFEKVGEVAANGTTSTEQNYSYTDAGIGLATEVAYYRLKQVDLDGTSQYAQTIVRVAFEGSGVETKLYPNPVMRGSTVTIESAEIKTVEIYGVNGQLVGQEFANGARVYTISTSDLSAGAYILVVNGKESKKFIVR